MPVQIEVNDALIQPLIKFYLERIKTLRVEISEREKELKDITSTIQKLKKPSIASIEDDKSDLNLSYSEKWPWVKKVQFAIELKGTPLTTKEVVDTLTEFEPTFLIDRRRVVASISSILSSKSGDGKEFTKIESESGDFVYDISEQEKNKSSNRDDDDDSLPF